MRRWLAASGLSLALFGCAAKPEPSRIYIDSSFDREAVEAIVEAASAWEEAGGPHLDLALVDHAAARAHKDADQISIMRASNDGGDCPIDYRGPGPAGMARKLVPGLYGLTLDRLTCLDPDAARTHNVPLVTAAAHELGHGLGLHDRHDDKAPVSVMFVMWGPHQAPSPTALDIADLNHR